MRTIILGMNYPKAGGGEALEIDVPGAAGWRLLDISGMTRNEFLDRFERRNLLDEPIWNPTLAKIAGKKFRGDMAGRSRTIIVLGRDVWNALEFWQIGWCESIVSGGCTWWLIAHPSGRNLYYNDQDNVARSRSVLEGKAA